MKIRFKQQHQKNTKRQKNAHKMLHNLFGKKNQVYEERRLKLKLKLMLKLKKKKLILRHIFL